MSTPNPFAMQQGQPQPSDQFAEFLPVPIPYKGINAITPIANMDPQECIYAYNLIANQYGMQVRPGYATWCSGMADAGGVRTVIAVRGNATGNDKLFACTSQGIYDCTSSTSTPTKVVSFSVTGGLAGWGQWEHITNLAADLYIVYCDEANGMYTYDTATSTWLQVTQGSGSTQISGVNPASFTFVRLFNNRLWFVQGSTGNSWFLPVGQIYGTVTQFSFGNKFNHGGNLNSLWQFTYGSYFGTYIYLVGISDSGDVIAYTGADPTQASTWTMSGQWYVGDVVPGRRCATNYGGDLTILSAYGAINLSALFYQKELTDPNAYLTKKIAPAIKAEVALNQSRGWEIVLHPGLNVMLILDPNYSSTYQFCYCLTTNAWTVFRGPPMQTGAIWHSQLYAGTPDGRVVLIEGGQDNVPIGGSSPGIAINWGCLGAFSQLRGPGVLKFVDLLRPYFLTDAPVPFNIFVRYDFNIQDLVLGSGVPAPSLSTSGWDSGIWDSAIWSTSTVSPQFVVAGQSGCGRWAAAGILGASLGNTTLVSYEASVRPTRGFL